MTGAAKKTVMRVLVEVGAVCADFQDKAFRNLNALKLLRIQLHQDSPHVAHIARNGGWSLESSMGSLRPRSSLGVILAGAGKGSVTAMRQITTTDELLLIKVQKKGFVLNERPEVKRVHHASCVSLSTWIDHPKYFSESKKKAEDWLDRRFGTDGWVNCGYCGGLNSDRP